MVGIPGARAPCLGGRCLVVGDSGAWVTFSPPIYRIFVSPTESGRVEGFRYHLETPGLDVNDQLWVTPLVGLGPSEPGRSTIVKQICTIHQGVSSSTSSNVLSFGTVAFVSTLRLSPDPQSEFSTTHSFNLPSTISIDQVDYPPSHSLWQQIPHTVAHIFLLAQQRVAPELQMDR